MATQPNRRRRFRRGGSEDTLPLRVQERDREIIKLAYDYRLLTSRHIQLLIPGSNQNLLRRLQKLFKHHYVDRIQVPNHQAMVYALANGGADELARMGLIERQRINWADKNRDLADHFVGHTLMVSDFRAVLTAALRDVREITMHSWLGEGELKHEVVIEGVQKRKTVARVIPDSSFILEQPRPGGGKPLQLHCFLEADRSTEAGRSKFYEKMKAYWTFWKEGTYQHIYKRTIFDVLTICKSEQRRDNLRRIAQSVSDNSQDAGLEVFRFASATDYTLDDPSTILKSIWMSARRGDEKLHSLLE